MVEFDPLYKIVSGTCGTFPNWRREKKDFSLDLILCLNFPMLLLLGSIIVLNVFIRESVPDNDRWTSSSLTANFSATAHEKNVLNIPLERAESRDYRNMKIFLIKCKIAVNRERQV